MLARKLLDILREMSVAAKCDFFSHETTGQYLAIFVMTEARSYSCLRLNLTRSSSTVLSLTAARKYVNHEAIRIWDDA